MSGLRVLITGASSGIGEALACEYARRRCRVVLAARRADRLQTVAEQVRRCGGEALISVTDVTDRDSVGRAVREAEQKWGGVDLAIANAGVSSIVSSPHLDLADARRIMDVNFGGMLNLFDAVVPAMVDRRSGHFAGIASLAGLRGVPSAPVYSASKAAMQNYLESMRPRLARHGVAVTIVNPGFVRSEMTAAHRFFMPFLMDSERAAALVATRLERHPSKIEFPLPMKILVRLLRLLPDSLYDRLGRGARSRRRKR